MEESRLDEMRARARELTDELGVDPALQQGALLARLMELCLADPEMASAGVGQRLSRLIPSRHAKVPPTEENEWEIEDLGSVARQPPRLLERMWRAHLSGYHDEGRGLEGSGRWARVSSEAGRLRDAAIQRAEVLPEEFEVSLRGHPTPHPIVAIELLRERLRDVAALLDRLEERVGQDLGMPAVGRRRHRRTSTDQRDLEAYFLCRAKGLASSDPRVRNAFASPEEADGIKDPRVATRVNRRASNSVGRMADRIASLQPTSVESWRGWPLKSASRLSDPHRALEEFMREGPPTDPDDVAYVEILKAWCQQVPEPLRSSTVAPGDEPEVQSSEDAS